MRENHLPLDAVTFQFGIVRDARDATPRASEETPVGGPKFKSSRYAMPVGPASPGFELCTSTMISITSCHGNRRSYTTIYKVLVRKLELPYSTRTHDVYTVPYLYEQRQIRTAYIVPYSYASGIVWDGTGLSPNERTNEPAIGGRLAVLYRTCTDLATTVRVQYRAVLVRVVVFLGIQWPQKSVSEIMCGEVPYPN